MSSEFDDAIRNHDESISVTGHEIWIGSEPTFTLRTSEDPQWLSEALGSEKESHALLIARQLFINHPGSILLRSVGHQYSNEDCPRWSFGIFERRDKTPVWYGPPDPIIASEEKHDNISLNHFSEQLESELIKRQWAFKNISSEKTSDEIRLLARLDNKNIDEISDEDQRLSRVSVHEQKIPLQGLSDSLAIDGFYLFIFKILRITPESNYLSIELPAFHHVSDFLDWLDVMKTVANAVNLPNLLIQGYPPPVDETVSWTTVTPDPAVIEINLAPQSNISDFYQVQKELYDIVMRQGLSPYRLQYNGIISDSGGGGQFTIGGSSAETSPFLTVPDLLPRLIRYITLHPSLSYFFATTYLGSNSQSSRVDEGIRDNFHELRLTLEQFKNQKEITPEFLYTSLSPFLTDPSGNTHRSELNIEKLWNHFLPHKGCLGLVEFRAFRMQITPERSAAIAMLIRAIIAMLSENDLVPKLHDWGDELHDRFALPYFQNIDLKKVLQDLDQHKKGLDHVVKLELLDDTDRCKWIISLDDVDFSCEYANEFWPLIGDVYSQENGDSRLVDASTHRLQVTFKQQPGSDLSLNGWRLQTAEYEVPMHQVAEDKEKIKIVGLRYRDYKPFRGLHPSVKPIGPLSLYLYHKDHDAAYKVSIYNWRFDGTAYDGLPKDLMDARQRRNERFIIENIKKQDIPSAKNPPDIALTAFTLDLRSLQTD